MRACLYPADCEPKESERLEMQRSFQFRQNFIMYPPRKCGMDFAYAYFVSFVFLSSFLVIKQNLSNVKIL